MARPVWVTKAGDLGVIAERQFYNLRFDVTDPDGGALLYSIVGGSLPAGLSLKDDGFIEGIPTVRKVFIRGVPTDVAEDVVNTFCVRCQTTTGDVSDRTFILTVSGQDIPIITSTTELLGNYFDGTYFEYQLTAVDLDNDILVWGVSNGSLPNGLTLDPGTGIISGYINLTVDTAYGAAGWFNTDWDQTPWDFRTQSVNKNFQFTISVNDGKDYALQKYRIYIISKDGMTADNTIVTADSDDIITADTDAKRKPVLLTPAQDLGVILHDNYFAYKFEGADFDGDPIQYDLVTGSVPGLSLDPATGTIPAQSLLEVPYTITVRVTKRDNPDYASVASTFTLAIIGDLGKFVQWITATDLGILNNGDVSEVSVSATNGLGRTLYYRLADNYLTGTPSPTGYQFTGDASTTDFVIDTSVDISSRTLTVYIDDVLKTKTTDWHLIYADTSTDQQFIIRFTSPPANTASILVNVQYDAVSSTTSSTYSSGKLPQGLELLPDGLISGRAAFNGFTIDGGTTTYDVLQRRSSSITTPTTFDTEFVFTVEVYDLEGDISTFKTFTLSINLENAVPYDNMYAVALLASSNRIVWRDLINNVSIIDPVNLYRSSDPYFGASPDVRLLVAAGIYPDTAENVQAAVLKNHYNKRVQLGDVKTARAIDIFGNVIYEVVYLEVSDNKITAAAVSSSSSLNLGNVSISGGFDPIIYPNSFINMRNELYLNLTQSNKTALPTWMSSKQADGTVLGLINAAVVCYTKPGYSSQIAFNVSRLVGASLSSFDIVLDRYTWDNNLSEYYSTDTGSFTASAETTFDKFVIATDNPLVATVNYAVEVPFSEINGRPLADVLAVGFDGVTSNITTGQTLIFAQQENYSINTELAWTRYTSTFDEDIFDSTPYEESVVIAGFDGSTIGERVAVYTITVQANGIVNLTKTIDVTTADRVDVLRGGLSYGGKSLYLNDSILDGNTVPTFANLADIVEGEQTIFDQNGTRFFVFKDVYAIPDAGDAYVKWPQLGVFV